eukprot:71782-Prymnesium_polylepis.1
MDRSPQEPHRDQHRAGHTASHKRAARRHTSGRTALAAHQSASAADAAVSRGHAHLPIRSSGHKLPVRAAACPALLVTRNS